MIHEFHWRGTDLLALLDEARAAKERRRGYAARVEAAGLADIEAETDEEFSEQMRRIDAVPAAGADIDPQLVFVHDEGVYMMSNAVVEKDQKRLVFYAPGYEPGKWPGLSGDDFAEHLDASVIDGMKPHHTLTIRLDPHADTFQILRSHPDS